MPFIQVKITYTNLGSRLKEAGSKRKRLEGLQLMNSFLNETKLIY